MTFVQISSQYAEVCVRRNTLKRQRPKCEFFESWRETVNRLATNPDAIYLEAPCFIGNIPLDERCDACKKRYELQLQINALTSQMRSLKRRMLTTYQKEHPSE